MDVEFTMGELELLDAGERTKDSMNFHFFPPLLHSAKLCARCETLDCAAAVAHPSTSMLAATASILSLSAKSAMSNVEKIVPPL